MEHLKLLLMKEIIDQIYKDINDCQYHLVEDLLCKINLEDLIRYNKI